MTKPVLIFAAVALLTLFAFSRAGFAQAGGGSRQTINFNNDWRFHLGEAEGGQNIDLTTADWRTLSLPHDWSIEGPVGADPSTMEGPFDRRSPAGGGGGFLNGGIGWYRKTFTLPPSAKGQQVAIQFDGAYMDVEVFLNGASIGKHPYGYTSFQFDITPTVKFDGPNVLAVRLNVQQPSSRWYSGAGIYRDVWLSITNPVHIGQWSTYITTPEVKDVSATVRVRNTVENANAANASATVTTTLFDPSGKEVASSATSGEIASGKPQDIEQNFIVANPQRWSIDTPALYRAVSTVRIGENVVDTITTAFGIRTFEFTADNGFFLNGKRVQIQGVCNHHDLGCLGAAVYRRGLERQLQILKEMGCNAIRTSHNPPSPILLELCDQMGFVVMDEAFDEWLRSKTRNGYGRFFNDWSESDIVSMVRRDRNHPSIVLWSIGNEISEQGDNTNGAAMAKRLADFVKREDPTRPITSACNNPAPAQRSGFAKALDVFGINYNIQQYQTFKGITMLGSETSSALSTRGEYNLVLNADTGKLEIQKELRTINQVTSYDLHNPRWGHTAETSLFALKTSPWVAGEFVWTGFDYIGEPTPFPWPARSSYFGIIDLAGFPKDRFYLYQANWSNKPVVHLLPHWNWEEFAGKRIPVWCFTNADSVELFLNDKSLGVKEMNYPPEAADDLHLEWSVAYAPGVLKAVGKKKGEIIATDEIRTAGKPARLVLVPDRSQLAASGLDLSYVTVRIVDANGTICPNADNKLTFNLTGPASIVGLDNGDPTNHESFQGKEHKAFHGLGLAVIRTAYEGGTATLTATADGLEPASVNLTVQP